VSLLFNCRGGSGGFIDGASGGDPIFRLTGLGNLGTCDR